MLICLLYFVDFSSNHERIETIFLLTFAVWPAVTSLVDPVYLSGLRHWPAQPFWFAAICMAFCEWKKRRTAASHHRAHAALLMQTLSLSVLAAAGQRSTSLFDHVCPPLASWMPFITLQSLNHRCAFQRKRGGEKKRCNRIGCSWWSCC